MLRRTVRKASSFEKPPKARVWITTHDGGLVLQRQRKGPGRRPGTKTTAAAGGGELGAPAGRAEGDVEPPVAVDDGAAAPDADMQIAPRQHAPSPKLARIRSAQALASGSDDVDKLSSLEWVQALYDQPGTELVATCGAMSDSTKRSGLDPDHLFLSMLRQSLIEDILFLWNSEQQLFHTMVALGPDVAGHPRITHGGFTAAVLDETTGGLVYELKKAGLLGPGPAFTARLEIDYKKPLPVSIPTLCTARVLSIEGRKCWTQAEMLDRPGGTVFAVAKALYVTPRTQAADGAAAAASAAQ